MADTPSIELARIEERGPLGERVYQILKQAIITAQLPLGSSLPEDHLVQALGVSRTPVREALKRLSSEGLVELPSRKAAKVIRLTNEELDQIFEAREVIETRFFVRAARSIPVEEFRAIKAELGAAEKYLDEVGGDAGAWRKALERYLYLDRAFHDRLIEASGNQYWIRFYNTVRDRIQIFAHLVSTAHPERFRLAIPEHNDILDAVIAGDFARGKALMRKHIRTFRARIDIDWAGQGTVANVRLA